MVLPSGIAWSWPSIMVAVKIHDGTSPFEWVTGEAWDYTNFSGQPNALPPSFGSPSFTVTPSASWFAFENEPSPAQTFTSFIVEWPVEDCDENGVNDSCEADSDADGTIDACDDDIDGDGIPNECDADRVRSLTQVQRTGILLKAVTVIGTPPLTCQTHQKKCFSLLKVWEQMLLQLEVRRKTTLRSSLAQPFFDNAVILVGSSRDLLITFSGSTEPLSIMSHGR